ncbi:SRPBCC family protein [Actinomadura rayongensis]|uniref:SRPBCC domain-containing protein n=1 Tax=Actinomadura rayongensis TaxID=1429076 RepID=A0A6I4W9M4_9ACTN|nr:SRPBCC domain-containing protein [Actinomadura rayongensis]MXQ66318.1 SRPBCC domain-containing protein [Actinomadura rayongensis]
MTDGAVRVTRTLRARPDDVFAAWTDPDRLRRWLMPGPGTVAAAVTDPVPGGGFRFAKLFPSGVDEVTGEYLVVDPPHRLVFTWRSPGTTGGRDSVVTVTLRPDGDGTAMTILHERLPAESFRSGARGAWTAVAANLDAHLTTTG